MEGIISKETCSVRRFFGLLDNIQTKLEGLRRITAPCLTVSVFSLTRNCRTC